MENFSRLGISKEMCGRIARKGFEEPTEIQEKVIPFLLKETDDMVGQAHTGTGKTAAFGIPLLERLCPDAGHVQVLVLTPTRELAVQVAEEINSLQVKNRLKVIAVYGGQSIEHQLRYLRRGVDIVVGTPGRIIDHLQRGTLKLDRVSHAVLDEADEMLNMGFIEDVERILAETNEDRRTLLFSATMPRQILSLARRYMKKYRVFNTSSGNLSVQLTEQIYFEVNPEDKFEALCRIIDVEPDFYALVFCRTKVDVDRVAHRLNDRGYDADALHGDLSQNMRERILSKFKRRRTTILVATDVAARGIDISNLSHVINFSLPQNPESYIHRIGRTGRAGQEGTAITFVTPDEYRKLLVIQRIAGTEIRRKKIPKVREVIEQKKQKVREEILSRVQSGRDDEYREFARQILGEHDPEEAVSALLYCAFEQELSEKKYQEIKSVSVNKKGTSRLFVALGKKEGMTPKKLIKFITEKVDVHVRDIRDIKIFDRFSFITMPFKQAESVLAACKKESRGRRRPLVTKARARKT
ncbi:MAG: DEAD/DEAH box helicase [Candidatus Omnitrophica bacterium]|nr:DEAD/DEAH box helicase [Candidatus Omnitrophota bacterium]